jgi:acetyltransferase-like isoleucine patch superfamily enzyme
MSAPSSDVPDWHHLPSNPYNPHAWVLGEPEIGKGCWIGAFCVIDGSGGLSIGAGCDISSGAQIYTHSTVRRCVSGGSSPVERAPTSIGAHTHVGAGAVVLMGVTVGRHCVVAAGAVVTSGTTAPDHSLLVGVPARVVPGGAAQHAAPRPHAGEGTAPRT